MRESSEVLPCVLDCRLRRVPVFTEVELAGPSKPFFFFFVRNQNSESLCESAKAKTRKSFHVNLSVQRVLRRLLVLYETALS